MSLSDPDARPIRKGKPQHPTEFGYTLLVAEDERGFGLRRTRLRRLAGARTWAGLGVLAYNLQRLTVTAR